MWPVRNKTIIGLKFNRIKNRKGANCVRNKTIIGLKSVIPYWSRLAQALEIRL